MDPFTVLKKRGHIIEEEGEPRHRSAGDSQSDDYNLATGPTHSRARTTRQMNPRDYKMPVDLTRSRRVGLSQTVCMDCGAIKDQGYCHHEAGCPNRPSALWNRTLPRWYRHTTGPLLSNQTSADTGWS